MLEYTYEEGKALLQSNLEVSLIQDFKSRSCLILSIFDPLSPPSDRRAFSVDSDVGPVVHQGSGDGQRGQHRAHAQPQRASAPAREGAPGQGSAAGRRLLGCYCRLLLISVMKMKRILGCVVISD